MIMLNEGLYWNWKYRPGSPWISDWSLFYICHCMCMNADMIQNGNCGVMYSNPMFLCFFGLAGIILEILS